jgi:DNA/RNA endonuclease YhcR with UshA esterase domain
MRKLLLTFLLLSIGAVAQEFPTQGPATQDHDKNSSRPKSYQGCVIRSNGSIMLADQYNRDYKLVGNGKSLDSYVGQEVKLTASNVNPSDPSSDERSISDGKPANSPQTLNVEDIAKVSDRCHSPK